ncbi:hypothetical protein Q31b_05310 [Novipirellula aureliae]|uniref:DUF1573 domain-containing protein n=1 Tax=Novipirellula aureliae TaxID=2527966 RepID=A0A5C6EDR0_9BACT|nr:DUF1573 domain-containing protein [Novipirellula aureliae]TWU45359.1 hypothetical protein Q31b_05310 [Novipirellula aureliae]
MIRFLLVLVLAAAVGGVVGWSINYSRFGHRTAYMGEMVYQGEIKGEDYAEHLASFTQAENPKVELPDGDTYDFGAMSPNEKGEHRFVIKNVGDGDLTLRLGATTCKCTLGTLKTDRLKPGEETDVLLEWNVKTNEKAFSQSAQILTNDPDNYAIDLKVAGRVVYQMEMVPDTLTFGEIASSEGTQLTAKIYNYMSPPIENIEATFSSEELNKFSDVTIEPFEPSDADGPNAKAVQGFRVSIDLKPGMRQGPVSQNLIFKFTQPNHGELVAENANVEVNEAASSSENEKMQFSAVITGKVVGSIGMIPNPRLEETELGNFIYDFGQVGADGPFKAKVFVVLKGENRDEEKLSIGAVVPEDVVKATLSEPLRRGAMTLYPLEFELIPGPEPIKRLGRNKDDYGKVRVVSEREGGDRLTIGLRFSLEPK